MSSFIQRIRAHGRPMHPKPTDVAARLERLSDIQTVLFDVYGTLIVSGSGDIGSDSSVHRSESLVDVVEMFGLDLACDAKQANDRFEDVIRTEHQRSKAAGIEYPEVDFREIWSAVLPDIVTSEISELDVSSFALEFELRVNPTWPMPGCREVLDRLSRRNLMLGIVSNAQFFTPLVIEALVGRNPNQLGFSSELTYFSFEHGHAKPGARLFELAKLRLAGLDIPPDRVLYVGNDMLNDIAAASRAGFRTALFAGDQRSLRLRSDDQRVHGVEADIVVTELAQLIECLPPSNSA